jgi:two-component system sensor histidine kinase BaeS
MKTKIFLAFLVVICTALLSNFIFEWLMLRDFEGYVRRVKEDQFFWIRASAESGYDRGAWDEKVLSETIHWAMMMGLDIKIADNSGEEVVSSHGIMGSLPGTMKDRMEGLFHVHDTGRDFFSDPIYHKGEQVGTLLWRPFQKKELAEKEAAFKKRTKIFLVISFLIAGVGSLLLAVSLSRYLSQPVTRLKTAAEKVATGDFSVRTVPMSGDEVGRLSEVFNKMAESLEREERLRKHLMSNIAHELRTPLTVMKTQVEAMSDGVITDTKKGLANISDEIGKLTRLVAGIEDITTAEASFFSKTEATEVPLGEFLTGIADDLRPLFMEKGLDLEVADGADLRVTVDTEKLERIVRNLLSNSMKFTRKGGVSVEYGTEGERFFIKVQDTGRGIPEDEIPLVFTRFYKASGSSGLGLGLAIVKELVRVMHGDISVSSEVDRGTCIRLSLPRAHV